MKKLFLLLLPGMLFLAGRAEAQLQKGTAHFGATISADGSAMKSKGLSSAHQTKGSNNMHNISPSVQTGWMIRDNRMFGFEVNSYFAWRKITSKSTSDYKYIDNYSSVGLSPFIRHYKPINSKWALFLQSGVDGAYMWTKKEDSGITKKDNGFAAGVSAHPGIVYWVSPRFAIESDLQLLSLRLAYTDFNSSKNFNFKAGITSGIGNYFGVRAAWYLQKSN
ncbi:hypothetical protein [Dyadobacter jiangsuensis]|uniref:Outer membrane protein with beta-barrel domain n=1 Tax=Dyadobacter jiangsuensis TaxID=1591085 RepID=A0A2P8G3X8_9BACT|nr:hypothetical protein [Dyadobacter jiangsuensis]PSL28679.1 hypothetical protein CLV60_106282 [Dyadobacter jiangsuensis]